jgi:hypothetical protein
MLPGFCSLMEDSPWLFPVPANNPLGYMRGLGSCHDTSSRAAHFQAPAHLPIESVPPPRQVFSSGRNRCAMPARRSPSSGLRAKDSNAHEDVKEPNVNDGGHAI